MASRGDPPSSEGSGDEGAANPFSNDFSGSQLLTDCNIPPSKKARVEMKIPRQVPSHESPGSAPDQIASTSNPEIFDSNPPPIQSSDANAVLDFDVIEAALQAIDKKEYCRAGYGHIDNIEYKRMLWAVAVWFDRNKNQSQYLESLFVKEKKEKKGKENEKTEREKLSCKKIENWPQIKDDYYLGLGFQLPTVDGSVPPAVKYWSDWFDAWKGQMKLLKNQYHGHHKNAEKAAEDRENKTYVQNGRTIYNLTAYQIGRYFHVQPYHNVMKAFMYKLHCAMKPEDRDNFKLTPQFVLDATSGMRTLSKEWEENTKIRLPKSLTNCEYPHAIFDGGEMDAVINFPPPAYLDFQNKEAALDDYIKTRLPKDEPEQQQQRIPATSRRNGAKRKGSAPSVIASSRGASPRTNETPVSSQMTSGTPAMSQAAASTSTVSQGVAESQQESQTSVMTQSSVALPSTTASSTQQTTGTNDNQTGVIDCVIAADVPTIDKTMLPQKVRPSDVIRVEKRKVDEEITSCDNSIRHHQAKVNEFEQQKQNKIKLREALDTEMGLALEAEMAERSLESKLGKQRAIEVLPKVLTNFTTILPDENKTEEEDVKSFNKFVVNSIGMSGRKTLALLEGWRAWMQKEKEKEKEGQAEMTEEQHEDNESGQIDENEASDGDVEDNGEYENEEENENGEGGDNGDGGKVHEDEMAYGEGNDAIDLWTAAQNQMMAEDMDMESANEAIFPQPSFQTVGIVETADHMRTMDDFEAASSAPSVVGIENDHSDLISQISRDGSNMNENRMESENTEAQNASMDLETPPPSGQALAISAKPNVVKTLSFEHMEVEDNVVLASDSATALDQEPSSEKLATGGSMSDLAPIAPAVADNLGGAGEQSQNMELGGLTSNTETAGNKPSSCPVGSPEESSSDVAAVDDRVPLTETPRSSKKKGRSSRLRTPLPTDSPRRSSRRQALDKPDREGLTRDGGKGKKGHQ